MRDAVLLLIAALQIVDFGSTPLFAQNDSREITNQQDRDLSSDQALVEQLTRQWQANESAIATAHIHHHTYSGSYPNSTLSIDGVDRLLETYDLAGDPDSFLSFLAELLKSEPISLSDLPNPPWFVREYHQLGELCRDESANGTLQIVGQNHEYLLEPSPSHTQATLFTRGGSWLLPPGMHLFLRNPSRSLPAERFRVVRAGEVIRLEVIPDDPSQQTVRDWSDIDTVTGMMIREVGHLNGKPYREWRQLGLTEYDGGIVLPTVSLTFEYRNGRLRQMFYRFIESAVLNETVDEELFEMPVPAGAVVVDQRGTKKKVVTTSNRSEDIVSFLAAVTPPPAGPPESRDSLVRWVLTINGLGLITLAVMIWRRGRRIAHPQTS